MKANVIILIIALTFPLLQSCGEDEGNELFIERTYSGIFYRVGPSIKTSAADVTLNLSGENFSGTTSVQNYPAICGGTFDKDEDSIAFSNQCAFTADFDWSFIVNGSYDIDIQDNYIYFIQEVGLETYNVFRFPRED